MLSKYKPKLTVLNKRANIKDKLNFKLTQKRPRANVLEQLKKICSFFDCFCRKYKKSAIQIRGFLANQ